jgi:hypothetical protein
MAILITRAMERGEASKVVIENKSSAETDVVVFRQRKNPLIPGAI